MPYLYDNISADSIPHQNWRCCVFIKEMI